MWNNTDIPLAYLITFRCYGTWLHGDNRGSIDRNHNEYLSPYMPASDGFEIFNADEMKWPPVKLDGARRQAVERAIREVCEYKKWLLYCLNVRTNHVHTLLAIGGASGSAALNSLKAYATRKMREDGVWEFEHSPWSRRGSKRRLWNERSIALAYDYVLNGQGGELPDFDSVAKL